MPGLLDYDKNGNPIKRMPSEVPERLDLSGFVPVSAQVQKRESKEKLDLNGFVPVSQNRPSSLAGDSKPESVRGLQTPVLPRPATTSMRAATPADSTAFSSSRKQIQALKHQYLRRGDGSVVRSVADALIKDPKDSQALKQLGTFHAQTQLAVLEVVNAERQHSMENIPHYGQLHPEGAQEVLQKQVPEFAMSSLPFLAVPGGVVAKVFAKPVGRVALGLLAAKKGVDTVKQVKTDIQNKDYSGAAANAAMGGAETGLAALGAAYGGRTGVKAAAEAASKKALVEGETAALQRIGEKGRAASAIAKSNEPIRPPKLPAEQVPVPRGMDLGKGITDFDQWIAHIEQTYGTPAREVEEPVLSVGDNINIGKVPIKYGPGSPVKLGPKPRTTLAPGEVAESAPPGEPPITFRQKLDSAERTIRRSMVKPKKGTGGSTNLPQMAALGVIKIAQGATDFVSWSKEMAASLPEEDRQKFIENAHRIYGIAVSRHQNLNTSPEFSIGGKNAAQEGQVPQSSVGEYPGVSQGKNIPGNGTKIRQGQSGQAGDSGSPGTATQVAPDEAVSTVLQKLREAKRAAPEVGKMYAQQRSERFAKYEQSTAGASTEAQLRAGHAPLKGQLEQPPYEPLKLEQPVADALYKKIKDTNLATGNELTAIEALDKVLGRGKYTDTGKGPRIPGPYEIKQLRKVFGDQFVDDIAENRAMTWGRWISDVMGLPRAVMETGNLHATLRQALPLSIANPKAGAAALGQGLMAMFSEKRAAEIDQAIRTSPNMKLMDQFGLHLSGPNLSSREEAFQSNLFGHLADAVEGKFGKGNAGAKALRAVNLPMHASNRGYATQLNVLRSKVFDSNVDMLKRAGVDPKNSPKEYKDLAAYINKMSGWGEFGKAEDLATNLGAVFYSPRLQASRIQLMADAATGFRGYAPLARKRAVKDLAVNATAMLSMLALAKASGLDVDTDPHSSDFGKFKQGNTRFDISGGFGSLLRPLVRFIAGEYDMHTSGKPPGFGKSAPLGLAGRTARSKLAPVPGIATDYLAGSDYAGKPRVTGEQMAEDVKEHFNPIILGEVAKAMNDENGASPALAIPLAFFGAGEQTYEPHASKPKKRPTKIKLGAPNY